MGRAYEVRKASIQKNGAVKAKLYSTFAKEIYLAAKNGGTDVSCNEILKRLITRAKDNQIPNDIITRAIDKVNKGITEDYTSVVYEGYGPAGSNIIVKGLTDNVNRILSYIRPAFTKNNIKLGASGSVSFMYDNLAVFVVENKTEDEILELMIDNDIDVSNIETKEDKVIIYAAHDDYSKVIKTLEADQDIKVENEELVMLAKDTVNLAGDDKLVFEKLLAALDEIEDVTDYYHNVDNI